MFGYESEVPCRHFHTGRTKLRLSQQYLSFLVGGQTTARGVLAIKDQIPIMHLRYALPFYLVLIFKSRYPPRRSRCRFRPAEASNPPTPALPLPPINHCIPSCPLHPHPQIPKHPSPPPTLPSPYITSFQQCPAANALKQSLPGKFVNRLPPFVQSVQ